MFILAPTFVPTKLHTKISSEELFLNRDVVPALNCFKVFIVVFNFMFKKNTFLKEKFCLTVMLFLANSP